MTAVCQSKYLSFGRGLRSILRFTVNGKDITAVAEPVETELVPQPSFPHDGCDCGIYGSVNLEEIQTWLNEDREGETPEGEQVLCLIEPAEGADVILCRKGWKAGQAFISEIIGETMTVEDASALLSIAWQREIDIRRLNHENR